MKSLKEIKKHLFSYDTTIDIKNKNNFGEVFTPTPLVEQMISHLDKSLLTDYKKTVIDSGCGNGQMLSVILYERLKNNLDFEKSISTIYGIDINEINVKLCRERLLCGREDLRHIVNKNIVCADALRYHYRFDGTDPYLSEQDLHNQQLFDVE